MTFEKYLASCYGLLNYKPTDRSLRRLAFEDYLLAVRGRMEAAWTDGRLYAAGFFSEECPLPWITTKTPQTRTSKDEHDRIVASRKGVSFGGVVAVA